MTEESAEPRQFAGASDPFVTQVTWLVAAVGGKDQLVQRCGGLVSVRTLDNWTAGNYPRAKVTGAVRELDAWASAHVPGYPQAAGVPRLVDSSGPNRVPAFTAVPDDAPVAPPDPPGDRRWLRWISAAAVLIAVAATSSLVTLLVAGRTAAAPDPVAAARSIARQPLPSTGNGKEYTEQAGHLGANTFADPRTLLDGSQQIPPHGTIQVRCRYYAPSIPSVTPDGFWYLIDSDQWAGRWTPANSFMNGDVPGGPSLHNTDFAVPLCK